MAILRVASLDDIGMVLRQARLTQKGFTLQEAHLKSGYSIDHIGKMERNKRSTDTKELKIFGKLYGLKICFLVGESTDDMLRLIVEDYKNELLDLIGEAK